MTGLAPVPATPAERFEAALRKAAGSLPESQVGMILRAADFYAAALVEQCARTPRGQTDPMQRRDDGDVA